jgi:hypothetical protein
MDAKYLRNGQKVSSMHLRIITHQDKGTEDAHSKEFWIIVLRAEAVMFAKSLKAWRC